MMRLVLLVLHVSFSDPLNHLNLRGNNTGVSGAATLSLSLSFSQCYVNQLSELA